MPFIDPRFLKKRGIHSPMRSDYSCPECNNTFSVSVIMATNKGTDKTGCAWICRKCKKRQTAKGFSVEQLQKMYEKLGTYQAVADKTGVPIITVHKRIKHNQKRDRTKTQCVELALKNNPQQHAANIQSQCGCSPSYTTRVARRLGISQPRNKSFPEDYLYDLVVGLTSQKEWERNTRGIITPKEIDMYNQSRGVGIEMNGVYYHRQGNTNYRKYHQLEKTNSCADKGCRLIHLWEGEVQSTQTYHYLKMVLGQLPRAYARKMTISNVKTDECRKFLNCYHMQGHNNRGTTMLGLYDQDQLVSIMTFGKSRFKADTVELIRYASRKNVVGGFGKLFKHYIKNNDVEHVTSYCDKRLFTGHVYLSNGFIKTHTTKPSYHYFKVGTTTLLNRMGYQKHRLSGKVEKFCANMTEYQNMLANGYDRVYDCGQDVYGWSRG